MMLDETTKARLHTMMAKALEHAEHAMEDHDWDKAHLMMEVARDADHVCRKHWVMEHHPEMVQ